MTFEKFVTVLTDLGGLYFWLFCLPIIFPVMGMMLWRRWSLSYEEMPDLPFGWLGVPALLFLLGAVGAFCGGLFDAALPTNGLMRIVASLAGVLLALLLIVGLRSRWQG